MRIVTPVGAADRDWLALRARLWPEASEAFQLRGMAESLARGYQVLIAKTESGKAVGFAEAAVRVDYVNGTDSSPVAFLEGLYVAPGSRRAGVARALVLAVEQWARRKGCSELASDCLLQNIDAHAVHRALGFEETERVVYFRKDVRG
jgi:aminoglycoside 6'-N-acetyltransferase I